MNQRIEKPKSSDQKNYAMVAQVVIQTEINARKVYIDRRCFAKTADEKLQLKAVKKEWKENQRVSSNK